MNEAGEVVGVTGALSMAKGSKLSSNKAKSKNGIRVNKKKIRAKGQPNGFSKPDPKNNSGGSNNQDLMESAIEKPVA